jgi:transposase
MWNTHQLPQSVLAQIKDLPGHGSTVTLRVLVSRWRCRNSLCEKTIFAQPLATATAYGRETNRASSILLLVGKALGGRGAERLLCRLGIPVSDDTILRRLKHAARRYTPSEPRIVGIDDRSQKKGNHYGTIMVDLERNCVVGLVADRSAESVAAWLALHPQITTISRDRNGLYAQGARRAAPAVTQVADRFHLVKNLREAVQRELSVKRHCLENSSSGST